MTCAEKFTAFKRRHHCRKCGECVCDGCSKGHLPTVRGMRRACDRCVRDYDNVTDGSPRSISSVQCPPSPASSVASSAVLGAPERRLTVDIGAGASLDTAVAVPVPVWVDDLKFQKCMLCDAEFTLLERRHHCRKCGRLVCWSCSENLFELRVLGKEKQRVCDPCFEELRDGTYEESPSEYCCHLCCHTTATAVITTATTATTAAIAADTAVITAVDTTADTASALCFPHASAAILESPTAVRAGGC